jgi:hypothetical protein
MSNLWIRVPRDVLEFVRVLLHFHDSIALISDNNLNRKIVGLGLFQLHILSHSHGLNVVLLFEVEFIVDQSVPCNGVHCFRVIGCFTAHHAVEFVRCGPF